VFILVGLEFLLQHLDLIAWQVAATPMMFVPSPALVKVVICDVTQRATDSSWTMGVVQNSPVQVFIAWCFMGGGRICKTAQRCLSQSSSAGYLGAAEEREPYKKQPKSI